MLIEKYTNVSDAQERLLKNYIFEKKTGSERLKETWKKQKKKKKDTKDVKLESSKYTTYNIQPTEKV